MRVPARQQAGDTPQIGAVIADKYCLERVLGSSGLGTVFSALHLMTGRRVALRWISAAAGEGGEGLERFIREFQVAAGIVHENVAEVLDAGTQDAALYIVLEYLEGESLAARIARGPLPASECVPILVQAMQGIAAGHRQGVVHRDLRPENIFICANPEREVPEIKVLDFGVMQASNACASRPPTFAEISASASSPSYMAPEQVLGQPALDQRVDVYALGMILYHALSGRVPFAGETGTRLLERIAAGSPPPLWSVAPLLPDGLSKVVMRALQRLPERRYPSIDDFAAALSLWAPGLDLWPSTMLAAELVEPGIYGPGAGPGAGHGSGPRDSGPRLRELAPPELPEREERRSSLLPVRQDLEGLDVAIAERHGPLRLDEGPWSDKTERLRLRSQLSALSESSILLIVAGCFVFATAWGLLIGVPRLGHEPATSPARETQPSAATDPGQAPARDVTAVTPPAAHEPPASTATEPSPAPAPGVATTADEPDNTPVSAAIASEAVEPAPSPAEANVAPPPPEQAQVGATVAPPQPAQPPAAQPVVESAAPPQPAQPAQPPAVQPAVASVALPHPAHAPAVQPSAAPPRPAHPSAVKPAAASVATAQPAPVKLSPVPSLASGPPSSVQATTPAPPAAKPRPMSASAPPPVPPATETSALSRQVAPVAKPGRKTSGVSLSDF